jgi:hypothetical protein
MGRRSINRELPLFVLAWLACGLTVAACGPGKEDVGSETVTGTDTGDGATGDDGSGDGGGGSGTGGSDSSDLVFFEASGCLGDSGDGLEYGGLQCIVWDTTDPDVTKIDLLMFDAACWEEWLGDASVEPDGTVELQVVQPLCGEVTPGCGDCLFDFSFGVANVPQSDEIALRVWVAVMWDCPDRPGEVDEIGSPSHELSLAGGSDATGAVCRYAAWYELDVLAQELGACGTLFMPCRTYGGEACGDYDDPDISPCDEGLVCADGEEADRTVCHPTCLVDEDCPWDGVLSCQAGLCRPTDPW